jgi:hypothetical protein
MAEEARVFTPKRTDRDDLIVRLVVEWGLLTRTEIRYLLKRLYDVDISKVMLERRIRALGVDPWRNETRETKGLGFLRSVPAPDDKWGEAILYPTQKACDVALENAWITQPVRAREKPPTGSTLVHHRRTVLLRFEVLVRFEDRISTSIATYLCEYSSPHSEKRWFADLVFYLIKENRYPTFFTEWENIREHSYKKTEAMKGYSERLQKCVAFALFVLSGEFAERFHQPSGRMLLIVPTARQAVNTANALRYMSENPREYQLPEPVSEALGSGMFWITDSDSILKDPTAPIYITPKDFEHRRYSLDEA